MTARRPTRVSQRPTPAPEGMTRLLVLPAHSGLRLDQLLAELSELSRRRSRDLIGSGLVWRNGAAVRVQSRLVETGDVIDVLRPPDELGCPARPVVPEVCLLHEDSWLVIADKPAGVLSQPSSTSGSELAFDQQLLLALAARDGRRPRLWLVHRLDRLTSGALLLARHSQALPPLTAAWQQGRVQRLYLAVVNGCPEQEHQTIEAAIERDRSHAWRFQVTASGRPARTEVTVLGRSGDTTLLACSLVTGRTHQVRVHLASIGLPVVGDGLYGGSTLSGPRRLLLHAACLRLPHPRTGRPLTVMAPPPAALHPYLPDDLEGRLQQLITPRREQHQ